MTDTIYALSSAPGKAGVAVVRVSGPQAKKSLNILIKNNKPFAPRRTFVSGIYCPQSLRLIDRAMIIVFDGPHSFTGEDVVEYHIHGSPAVLEELLEALSCQPSHRMALPGEYSRRAFENGKMDLTEAEAIADLIDAETELQKQQALDQMGGSLSRLYGRWAEQLTRILAYVEAVIDFPDEDVPDEQIHTMMPQIQELHAEIEAHLNDNRRGERLREGIRVAVLGAPNAGKSSLVNALVQRDIAIVSPTPGTTRDVIEAHLNIGGYPVILSDTAGLRDKTGTLSEQDAIEQAGIARARATADDADIRLLVCDGTTVDIDKETALLINSHTLVVINKCDLFHVKQPWHDQYGGIPVSASSGINLDKLCMELEKRMKSVLSVSRETPALTRQRHRTTLEEAAIRLCSSLQAPLPELIAEDLRLALRALGRLTGRVDVEDLLDVIFRDFCIGK